MIRLLLSIPIGIAITFGLFVLMAQLIANNARNDEKPEETPQINIVMEKPSESVQKIQRLPPPPPPPPAAPPPPEQPPPETSSVDAGAINMSMPSISAGGLNTGLGDISGAMMKDGDIAPISRFEPRYPPQASRDGIEGWVKLRFSIDTDGSVTDIEIIESQPKRIFDREAKKALSKWIYKPKIEDGKPVKRPGVEVQLDFNLGD
jgi:protein TonB